MICQIRLFRNTVLLLAPALGMFFLACYGFGAEAGDEYAAFRASAQNAVVVVRAAKGNGRKDYGTGFLVDKHGTVITNWHVVNGAHNVTVEYAFENDKKCPYGLAHRLPDNDLAMMKPLASIPPIDDALELRPPKDFKLEIATPFLMIGHPNQRYWTHHEGKVSRIFEIGGMEVYQGAVPAAAGASGSPILLESGELLGVLAAGDFGGIAELNFIIPYTYLEKLDLTREAKPFDGTSTELGLGGLVGQDLQVVLDAARFSHHLQGVEISDRIDDTRKVPLGKAGVEYLLDEAQIEVVDVSVDVEGAGLGQKHYVNMVLLASGKYKEKHFRGAGYEYHTKNEHHVDAKVRLIVRIGGDIAVMSSEVLQSPNRGKAGEMLVRGSKNKIIEIIQSMINRSK